MPPEKAKSTGVVATVDEAVTVAPLRVNVLLGDAKPLMVKEFMPPPPSKVT